MTHTSTEQPEALRLADIVERLNVGVHSQAIAEEYSAAARELRSLHARVQELEFAREIARACAHNINAAAQAQRVPLSDSEIDDAWEGATGGHSFTDKTRRDFVRAIEKAHGITQEKQG